jgi:hypothetical protein
MKKIGQEGEMNREWKKREATATDVRRMTSRRLRGSDEEGDSLRKETLGESGRRGKGGCMGWGRVFRRTNDR